MNEGHREGSNKIENILETVNLYKGLMNKRALNNNAFDWTFRTYPIYQCNISKADLWWMSNICNEVPYQYTQVSLIFKRLSLMWIFVRYKCNILFFINPLTSILLREICKLKTKTVVDKSFVIEGNLAILINQIPIKCANYNKMNNIFLI